MFASLYVLKFEVDFENMHVYHKETYIVYGGASWGHPHPNVSLHVYVAR